MELSIVVESSSRSDLGLSLDLDNVVVFVEAREHALGRAQGRPVDLAPAAPDLEFPTPRTLSLLRGGLVRGVACASPVGARL